MTTATGTLNGTPVLRMTLIIAAWGLWTADIETASMDPITVPSSVTVQLADVTFTGTVVDGGVYQTRSWYRVVAGAAGLRKTSTPHSYRGAAGVMLSEVVGDVARDANEQLGTFADRSIGAAFSRPVGATYARTLDLVSPRAWYVDEKGVLQIGTRPVQMWTTQHREIVSRPDRGWVLVSSESIAGLVPGAQLENITAGTVRHTLTPESLRSLIFVAQPDDALLASLADIIRGVTAPTFFHGHYGYTVTGGSGGYLDVDPEDESLGLPPHSNVPVRVGAFGARGTPAVGSGVLVGFKNGSPATPYVHSFEGEWGGTTPTESDIFASVVKIGDASATALALANKVNTELGKLQTAHNTHVHVLAISAAPGSGGTGTAAAPLIQYTPGDVSCSKAMGT